MIETTYRTFFQDDSDEEEGANIFETQYNFPYLIPVGTKISTWRTGEEGKYYRVKSFNVQLSVNTTSGYPYECVDVVYTCSPIE